MRVISTRLLRGPSDVSCIRRLWCARSLSLPCARTPLQLPSCSLSAHLRVFLFVALFVFDLLHNICKFYWWAQKWGNLIKYARILICIHIYYKMKAKKKHREFSSMLVMVQLVLLFFVINCIRPTLTAKPGAESHTRTHIHAPMRTTYAPQ